MLIAAGPANRWRMILRTSVSVVVLGVVAACGASTPPPPVAAEPAGSVPVPAAAPSASASPVVSPEEAKKAKEREELTRDWATWEAEHKAELARWTPELRAEAKALASKAYPDGKAAVKAALAGKHRMPDSASRDKDRHPVETLAFLGFKPTMTVLEYSPGAGWVTEILAPSLAAKGKLIVTSADPNGPREQRGTLYGARLKAFLEKSPEAYGKVQTLVVNGKAPQLGLKEAVDLALVFRGMHGMHNNGTLGAWLSEIHAALKPNGVLGVEQHRAKEGDDPSVSAKAGYLPEAWLIAEVEKAGFKLLGKSEVNANARDTKDHPEGVWSLPPTLRQGEINRDKYVAIGESDRMTLKFGKVGGKK